MTRQIPLSRGEVALVDDSDFDRLVSMGSWYASPDGRTTYAGKGICVAGKKWRTVLMHSVITGWDYVDHINGNGLDNRRVNLRQATASQNQGNRRISINNKSGFKGVSRHTQTGLWHARIGINGGRKSLGLYEDPADAARAYDRASVAHFGEFARTNFPQEA